jgi:hypothetical protein
MNKIDFRLCKREAVEKFMRLLKELRKISPSPSFSKRGT